MVLIDESDMSEVLKQAVIRSVIVIPHRLRRHRYRCLTERFRAIAQKTDWIRQLESRWSPANLVESRYQSIEKTFEKLCFDSGEPSLADAVESSLSSDGSLCKKTRFSARLLPVPDAQVAQGSCVLPYGVAQVLFRPFAVGVLQARMPHLSSAEIDEMLNHQHEKAVRAIEDVARLWPALVVSETQGLDCNSPQIG